MKRTRIGLIIALMIGIPLTGFSYAQGQDEEKPRRPGKRVERKAGEARQGRAGADRARILERLEKSGGLPDDPAARRAFMRRLMQQKGGDRAGNRRGQDARRKIGQRRGQQQGRHARERFRQGQGQIDPQRMKVILERIEKDHPEAARLLKQRIQQGRSVDRSRRPGTGRGQVQPPRRAGRAGKADPKARKDTNLQRLKEMEERIKTLKTRLNEARKASKGDGEKDSIRS